MDNSIEVGGYKISLECEDECSCSCNHYVINKLTDNSCKVGGNYIYFMLKNNGMQHEHFNQYMYENECISVCKLAEKHLFEMNVAEQFEYNRKQAKKEALNVIINEQKSSTHLEQLKMNNCR